jgi:peptidoglycan-N-acetylglucosamine deacetylase
MVLCLCVAAAGNILRTATRPFTAPNPAAVQSTVRIPAAWEMALPDCTAKPCLALTFDDGPNPLTTPHILDILASEHVPATFFVVGQRVPGNEALIRRMYMNGDEVGNHSWSHPDFTKLSQAQITDQVQRTQAVIVAAGVPAPHLLRPPYGSVNPSVLDQLHMTAVEWNIDPEDWAIKDPAKIDTSIISHAKPGGIVLMHDIYPTTVDALRPAIDNLKTHYQLVTVSQLMHLEPGDQGLYFGHYY